MCNTRKRITLHNNDTFYLCSCADSRITKGPHNAIDKVNMSKAAFIALQQGKASDCRVISKAPHDCYAFVLKSNSNSSEKTPLLREKTYSIIQIQAVPVGLQITSGLFSVQGTPTIERERDASDGLIINS